jgi:hypothetical protein
MGLYCTAYPYCLCHHSSINDMLAYFHVFQVSCHPYCDEVPSIVRSRLTSIQGSFWSCSLLSIVVPSMCQRFVLIFLCNILHVSSHSNIGWCKHICIRQEKLSTPLSSRMSTHDFFIWAGGLLAISLSQCYTNYGLR